MNNQERYNQQKNRLSTLTDDSSLGLDFIKHLVEAQTGKTVKSITPMQVLGKSADYSLDNRAFFALSMTMFPLNYVPPVGGGTVVSGFSGDASEIISGTLNDARLSSNVAMTNYVDSKGIINALIYG